MRIIGGTARGRRLRAPDGTALRPTPDRVREAMFDILAGEIVAASFLDLYAGTGAVGLEALSRGAARAVMVEKEGRHAAVLRANLAYTGLAGGEVLDGSVLSALERLAARGDRFGIAFLDPPYAAEEERTECLRRLARGDLLSATARLVAELPSRAPSPAVAGLGLDRRVRYGDTSLAFYVLANDERS